MKKITKGASAPVSAPTATATSSTASPSVITTMNDPSVQACIALLGQVSTHVGETPVLDGSAVRRSTKMRKGGAGVIPQIIALCTQKGITQIGSLTTTEMVAQLQRGDALVQVGKHAGVLQKQVREAGMGAHGRSWQIAMTMYRTLQRMAVNDPELALGLQPVQDFFKAKKKDASSKEASATAETPGAASPVASAPDAAPAAPAAASPGGAH